MILVRGIYKGNKRRKKNITDESRTSDFTIKKGLLMQDHLRPTK